MRASAYQSLGLVTLFLYVCSPAPSTSLRSQVSRVKNDMRSIATVIESYQVDNRAYPRPEADGLLPDARFTMPIAYMTSPWEDPFKTERRYYAKSYPLYLLSSGGWVLVALQLGAIFIILVCLCFRYNENLLKITIQLGVTSALTLAVIWLWAHVSGDYYEGSFMVHFPNRENRNKSKSYYYYTDSSTGWILQSVGPNFVRDLTDLSTAPLVASGSVDELIPYTYDPTNGTISGGDVFRLHQ